MKVTVIGAGNSGLAMAAHLSSEGNQVTLWNRTRKTIELLMKTNIIRSEGVVIGNIPIYLITDDIGLALKEPDIVLITTPASSHKDLAELIAKNIKRSTIIVLNPGRTLGAVEFRNIYEKYNSEFSQVIAETQTIIYACRKTEEDAVNIITFKDSVLISSLESSLEKSIIEYMPDCLKEFFVQADSMIQTSIGNVGMILHCAPLLLNTGWTESEHNLYKYYYDGITHSVASFIEKIDKERVEVSKVLGFKVESTQEWLVRTYHVNGDSLFECIQNNESYRTIDAPTSLKHRYIYEDVPCGLVPLEAIGLKLGLDMTHTTLVIDLASRLVDVDFRKTGRNLDYLNIAMDRVDARSIFERKQTNE